ncbi:hypothetical protein [Streptomyces sp. NPDC001604]|uniref:hypothetical protein n=1 Tax=Streptomyces sp. NPDC001604 TaxID=3364593 RepID=UPI003694985F
MPSLSAIALAAGGHAAAGAAVLLVGDAAGAAVIITIAHQIRQNRVKNMAVSAGRFNFHLSEAPISQRDIREAARLAQQRTDLIEQILRSQR